MITIELIGGPADGQQFDVKDNTQQFVVPIPPDLSWLYDPDPDAKPPEILDTRNAVYLRTVSLLNSVVPFVYSEIVKRARK